MTEKTVAEMSEQEQIVRLLAQRNALWRMIDKFITEHGSDGSVNFLRPEDAPRAHCEIEDDEIIVRVTNTLDNLSTVRFEIDSLENELDAILGNTYVVEGRNHSNGELNPDNAQVEPYLSGGGVEPWW